MVPVCFPSKISSTTGLREAVVFALSSVTGLVRWTDYIPVKLVASADAALEGRTDAGGFIPMDMLSSNTGLMGWVDYLPVYVDNSATDAWAITATGFIPYAASGGGSSPAFTVIMTALTNATGVVTTLAYINPGSGGGTFTPSFTMSRDTLKAGGQVYFDASATASAFSTNPEHELTFEWEFGDEDGTYWLYGRDLAQSRNVAYGPQATHVFETPGVKTIKLTATDPMGNSGITTHTVTVNAWAEANTIYVGNGTPPTAGSNGVGFGATYVSATTASAIAALIATGKRIRFDNSATWSITSQIAVSNKTGWRIDGFGAGTAPTFNNAVSADWTAMFTTNSGCSDFSFSGLKAVGTQPDKIGAVSFGGAPANHALYHKLEVTGSHEGITAGGCDVLSIVGCNIHDIGASNTSGNNGTYWYGLYNESVTRFAVIGSAVDNIVSGHCVRTPGVARGVYANNTIRKARHGYGGGKGHALTIRGFTNGADSAVWNGLWTEKVVVCDNILGDFVDEGIEPLQLASQNSGDASRHRNIIVERNVISSNLNSCILSEVSSNLTIRSNLLLTNGAPYAIRIANITTVGAPLPSDTKIYNNTVYKTTSANYNGFSAIYLETGTSGTLIANNLAYAPEDTRNGLASTSEGAQSTFICGAGTNTLVGGNSTNSQVKNTKPWAATTPASPADYAPNSYGLNGGVSVPVFKDLFNATITGTREIGAIQA